MLRVALAELLLKNSLGHIVLGIDQIGHGLEIIVKATLPQQQLPKGMVAELPYPINPLIYNYGLPLCLALILSSPDDFVRKGRNILFSIMLLLPVQIWGICFDFLKTLFLQTPSHLIGNYVLQQSQLEVIGICYQVGALVLPPVAPLVILLILYRNFINGVYG